jgi:choline dehydrogenase-like flavoprotein
MKSTFNKFDDWPISYSDLDKDKDNSWYGKAEHSIGVSADVGEQEYLGINFAGGYKYPMPALPDSMTDQFMKKIDGMPIDGVPVKVRITPAARNSQPFDLRRVCAGNTNCIPICPIQAKYDPTITVNEALRTGNVEIRYRSVASEVLLGENGRVSGVKYREYVEDSGPNIEKSVTATVVVLAANAIETPKLLLMSTNEGKLPNGVGNSSGKLGRYLMDHPYHVTWGLVREQVWPYRGPLSTSGIEDLRDAKRSERGAFRVEIGNEGWNFVVAGSKKGGDPNVTTLDFINGLNNTGLNKDKKALFGKDLTKQLNDVITRQIRLGFLIEQEPEEKNRIELSGQFKDNLGLPRPQITYDLSDYTKAGIAAARQASDEIFKQLNAEPFTTAAEPQDSNSFEWPLGSKSRLNYLGAGHIMGTYRMGTTKDNSVVDREQRSWDHKNLFMVGSGVFPTVGTANPTLTIAALSLWAADTILKTELKG